MIRVTVELIPPGPRGLAKTLGTVYLHNTEDHPQHPQRARYYVEQVRVPSQEVKEGRKGVVEDHARHEPVWTLVRKAIAALGF